VLSNSYLVLRPFFRPVSGPVSDDPLDSEKWEFGENLSLLSVDLVIEWKRIQMYHIPISLGFNAKEVILLTRKLMTSPIHTFKLAHQ